MENENAKLDGDVITPKVILRAVAVTVVSACYVTLFWYKPTAGWAPIKVLNAFINNSLLSMGVEYWWRFVVRSTGFVALAIGVVWAFGHPPGVLGLGKMAKKGWRITLTGFVLASPVLVATGLDPQMHHYYRRIFELHGWKEAVANGLVMFSEHAFIEGVVLSLALPEGLLAATKDEPVRTGKLSWLGFGMPVLLDVEGRGKRILAWLGLPKAAIPALVGQALVFFMVHVSKPPIELYTSFFGGFLVGFLTFKVRSVWPGVILHIGTGWFILVVIYFAR
ncbi:MAG: CPBP family intramembrane metalloprotease [Deltaproteobacteria bacterium]|nr:CPBP family intramembrane metalloprotease [Deltaproteobacteria bacterium]